MSTNPHIETQMDSYVPIKDDVNYRPKLPDQDKIKEYQDVE